MWAATASAPYRISSSHQQTIALPGRSFVWTFRNGLKDTRTDPPMETQRRLGEHGLPFLSGFFSAASRRPRHMKPRRGFLFHIRAERIRAAAHGQRSGRGRREAFPGARESRHCRPFPLSQGEQARPISSLTPLSCVRCDAGALWFPICSR